MYKVRKYYKERSIVIIITTDPNLRLNRYLKVWMGIENHKTLSLYLLYLHLVDFYLFLRKDDLPPLDYGYRFDYDYDYE